MVDDGIADRKSHKNESIGTGPASTAAAIEVNMVPERKMSLPRITLLKMVKSNVPVYRVPLA